MLLNLDMCMHQVSATFFIHVSPKQVLFPYDEFLKLYNWKDFDFVPCGLMNCGNRYDGIRYPLLPSVMFIHDSQIHVVTLLSSMQLLC
jgi:hypothetical protein